MTTGTGRAERAAGDLAEPFVPRVCRVVARRVEAPDVVTLSVERPDEHLAWRPGQFNMLTVFGVGEVAISIASAPGERGPIRHTVRDVGKVSHALCTSPPGSLLGVSGPFGTDWGLGAIAGEDVVVVAGGIGLAPLRGAVDVLADRAATGRGRLFVAVGARSPEQVIFGEDLDRWQSMGAQVEVTVDAAPAGYDGRVGLVTELLAAMSFEAGRAAALVCGPEVMMRLAGRKLVDVGLDAGRIAVSLERNMQCGVGLCGHCQLGPVLLCRDGPVLGYDRALGLMSQRER